jgi:hypothetical protein
VRFAKRPPPASIQPAVQGQGAELFLWWIRMCCRGGCGFESGRRGSRGWAVGRLVGSRVFKLA